MPNTIPLTSLPDYSKLVMSAKHSSENMSEGRKSQSPALPNIPVTRRNGVTTMIEKHTVTYNNNSRISNEQYPLYTCIHNDISITHTIN